MTIEFTGFTQDGLSFLRTLGTKNKAWFDEHRATYASEVVEPTKAFVTAIGERLADGFAREIVAQPKANGSIAPINNDLRFSPDTSPYKDHLLLKFWEGTNKKIAPTLYIRLSADDVGFATGVALPDLERWRLLIADEETGAELTNAISALAVGRQLDIAGEGYKRVPAPYHPDHPRAGLLRHKAFQARWSEPVPPSVTSDAFVDHCVARLEACAPIHRWFVQNL